MPIDPAQMLQVSLQKGQLASAMTEEAKKELAANNQLSNKAYDTVAGAAAAGATATNEYDAAAASEINRRQVAGADFADQFANAAIMGTLAEQYNATTTARDLAQQNLQASYVSVLDNPIDWLMSGMTAGTEQAKVDGLTAQADNISKKMMMINQHAQEFTQTQRANILTATEGMVTAKAKQIRSAADEHIAKSEVQRYQDNNNYILAKSRLTTDGYQLMASMSNDVRQQASFEAQMEENRLRHEERAAALAAAQDAKADKAAAANFETRLARTIAMGAAMFGDHAIAALADENPKFLADMYKSGGENGDKLRQYHDIGTVNAQREAAVIQKVVEAGANPAVAAYQPSIAGNAGDAAIKLVTIGNNGRAMPQRFQPVVRLLNDAMTAANQISPTEKVKPDLKNPQVVGSRVIKVVDDALKTYSGNVDPSGTTYNPLRPLDLKSLTVANGMGGPAFPEVVNNPVFQKYLKPALAVGEKTVDYNTLIKYVQADVAAQAAKDPNFKAATVLTPQLAKQISQLYSAVQQATVDTRGFGTFGIEPPKRMGMTVDTVSALGRPATEVLDVMSPTKVAEDLARRVRASMPIIGNIPYPEFLPQPTGSYQLGGNTVYEFK